jgi:hypothetical protein
VQAPELRALEGRFVEAYAAFIPAHIKGALLLGHVDMLNDEARQVQELGLTAEHAQRLSALFGGPLDTALQDKIRADISAKRYYSAFRLIKSGGKEEAFAAQLAEIRLQGASFYLAQARARLRRGEEHYAYLQALKGYELSPDLSGMFELHRDVSDKVISGMQRYVAVSAFGAPADNPSLGPQFSDALTSFLFRVLPYGVNIVEREKIDVLMRERQRELKELSSLLKVDWIISGNVSLMEIDKQRSVRKGKVQADSGQIAQINPAWEEWRRDEGDEDEEPPQYISVPSYATVDYEAGRVTLKAFATVSARIFDARKGEITYAQQFNARYETGDDFQQGVQGAQIKEDPLELPSETEVHEILRGKVIEQLASLIQAEFAKRKSDAVQAVESALMRKETGRAMRPLAEGIMYCVQAKAPFGDQDFRRLREMVLEYTEGDFV